MCINLLILTEPSFKLVVVLECAELVYFEACSLFYRLSFSSQGFWWLAMVLSLFIVCSVNFNPLPQSSTGSFAYRPFAHNWMDGGWLEFLAELHHQDHKH
jgi:hypothetical protein